MEVTSGRHSARTSSSIRAAHAETSGGAPLFPLMTSIVIPLLADNRRSQRTLSPHSCSATKIRPERGGNRSIAEDQSWNVPFPIASDGAAELRKAAQARRAFSRRATSSSLRPEGFRACRAIASAQALSGKPWLHAFRYIVAVAVMRVRAS